MEQCEHKVIIENPITGDPLNPKVVCIKCGEKAELKLYEIR